MAARRIAILYPPSASWIAACLGGVRRYARSRSDWHLFSRPSPRPAGEPSLSSYSMRGWKGDAIIAATNDASELRDIREMGIPAVNLSAGLPDSHGVPRVLVDGFHGGRLAADHLLARGIRHLAFFGWEGVWYSDRRRLGFCRRAGESGIECGCFLQSSQLPGHRSWLEQIGALAGWVASLPRPVGIFAANDDRAQILMEACQEAELRIPDDVALIGMDNDETICEHSVPTLTSVSRNADRVGWEAAALLDRMMQGEPPPIADLLLEPDGVVARKSTDMLYCADPVVRAALDYMRANLRTPFNIEQLAEHVGVSKRKLEMCFRASLQSSPHEFLTKLRVQRAQVLMQMPQKRAMELTARECGFGTRAALYAAFRRVAGESAADFRERHRDPGGRRR